MNMNINTTALPSSDSARAPVAAPRTEAAPAAVPQAAAKSAPSPAELQSMVASANKAMQKVDSNLAFSVDESTNKTVITVSEKTTGQVIMQFPTEDMLSITRAIDSAQQGILLKQQA